MAEEPTVCSPSSCKKLGQTGWSRGQKQYLPCYDPCSQCPMKVKHSLQVCNVHIFP